MQVYCTSTNVIANLNLDAGTGQPVEKPTGQTIVQFTGLDNGHRVDVTITNPPASLGPFAPGDAYEITIT